MEWSAGIHGRAIKKKRKKTSPNWKAKTRFDSALSRFARNYERVTIARWNDVFFLYSPLHPLSLSSTFSFLPFVSFFLIYISRSREDKARIFVRRKASVSSRSSDDAPGDWHLQTWSKPFTVLQLTRDSIAGMVIPIHLSSSNSRWFFFLFWKYLGEQLNGIFDLFDRRVSWSRTSRRANLVCNAGIRVRDSHRTRGGKKQ